MGSKKQQSKNILKHSLNKITTMTFSDAKDQIAKKLYNTSYVFLANRHERNCLEQAAELYAEEKAREAFDAAREQIKHPDWDYVYEDFEAWKKVNQPK